MRVIVQNRVRGALNAVHLCALLGLALFGLFFDALTGGLVYELGGEVHACIDNGGSSADDSEAFLLFGIMLIPAAIRMAFYRRHITLIELLLVVPLLLLSTTVFSEIGCGWENLTVEAMGFPWRLFVQSLFWTYLLSALLLMFARWPNLIR